MANREKVNVAEKIKIKQHLCSAGHSECSECVISVLEVFFFFPGEEHKKKSVDFCE